MNDAGGGEPGGLELALRDALRGSVAGLLVHPDEQDVRRRMRVRARRRRASTVGMSIALLAATAIGLAAVQRKADPQPIAATSSSTAEREPAVVTTVVPSCELPAELPFVPTVLPGTWTRSSYEAANEGVPEVWTPTDHYGIVEIWNGRRADLPEPDASEPVTVLGRAATIGPISDGYSMVVQLGPTPCDRWALVAHPGIDQAELRTIAEGLRPADSSSSTAVTTAPSATATSAVASAKVAAVVVSVRGSDLVEVGERGSEKVVASLPPDLGGLAPELVGAGDHLLVVYGGRVFVYDARRWGQPLDAGTFWNVGIVPAPGSGFWAADPPTSNGAPVTWRTRSFGGASTGASVTIDGGTSLPIGAVLDGLAVLVMDTGHLIVSAGGRRVDLGSANAIAADGERVAYRTSSGQLRLYSAKTDMSATLGDLGAAAPAQTIGAGAFSPDGRYLAVALSGSAAPYPAAGLALVDLTAKPSPTLLRNYDVAAIGVQWAPDSSALLLIGDDELSWLDPRTGVSRRLGAGSVRVAVLAAAADELRPVDGSSPSPSSARVSPDRVIAVDRSNIVEKRPDGEEVVVAPLPLAAAADAPALLDGGDHVLIVVDGRVYVYDSRAWAPPVDAGPSLGLGLGVVPRIGFWSVDHMSGSLADGPTGEVVTWRLHGWDGRPVGPSVEVDRPAQAVGATADGVFLQIMASAHLLYVSASGPTDFGECEVVASYGGRVACHRPRDGAYVVIEAAGAVTPIGTVGSLGLQAGVGAAAFAPSGRHLAIGRVSGGTSPTGPGTLLVDLADPTRNRDLAGLDGSGGVLWSADGTRLLVVADQRLDANDGVVRPASAQWVDVGSGEAVGGRVEVSPPVVVIAPR